MHSNASIRKLLESEAKKLLDTQNEEDILLKSLNNNGNTNLGNTDLVSKPRIQE